SADLIAQRPAGPIGPTIDGTVDGFVVELGPFTSNTRGLLLAINPITVEGDALHALLFDSTEFPARVELFPAEL
ncbi:MAG: hypothetical protein ABIO65_02450, partial [Nitrospiria bacterium]